MISINFPRALAVKIAPGKTQNMTEINQQLFEAFRSDHAVLGRGLYELRSLILSGDLEALKAAADKLDQAAGAHIAFEEEDFYPALKAFLSDEEVGGMYAEHAQGAETLKAIKQLAGHEIEGPDTRDQLLEQIDEMEKHVSECGELFGAMGGLDESQKKALLRNLNRWRERAPSWTSFSRRKSAGNE